MGRALAINAFFGIAAAQPNGTGVKSQLAVHDVQGPHPVLTRCFGRWISRDVVIGMTGVLRPSRRRFFGTMACFCRPFPQCHHRGRAVRRFCRSPAVSRRSGSSWTQLGQGCVLASLIGFYVTFVPPGPPFGGMTRRLQHYDVAAWRPWILAAGIGIVIMISPQPAKWPVRRQRPAARRISARRDPWDGRSLEWATASPPPV